MKLYHCAISMLALSVGLAADPAVAQTLPVERSPGSPDDQATASTGEIIVTAQRRSERARDVPISLTALSGDELETLGIIDNASLQNVTPGLVMERIGIYSQPAIRGITTVITGPGVDANVATYLDGVYQTNNSANAFDLPDVERVEVLKGPQGTLFGRNATGGAIQIYTKNPSYIPTGSLKLSYGNYNDFSIRGFISGPLVEDKIAISLAGYYRQFDAYDKSVVPSVRFDDNDTALIRGKIRVDPTENLSVTFSARYSLSHIHTKYSLLNENTEAKLYDPATVVPPPEPRRVAVNGGKPTRVEAFDTSAIVELELGDVSLKSITAYSESRASLDGDSDGAFTPSGASTIYHVNEHDDSFSQELSVSSDLAGPVNFVAGVYYTKAKARWAPLGITFPTGFAMSIHGVQDIEAIAGFGEINYEITPELTLIGGLRYSWEKRSLESDLVPGASDAPRPAALTFRGEKSWDAATPRLSLRYAITPRDNAYFTYSQGFKSGAYNTSDLAPMATPVNPEKIKAYEIGYKGNPFDALSLNLAAFYYDHRNLQQNTFQVVGGVPLSLFTNAANSRTYGFEADADFRFSASFSTRVGLTFLDAKFKDFANAGANIPNQIPGNPPFSGNTTVPFDASGLAMVRAPKFSASITPNFTTMVAGGEMNLNGTLYYSAKTYLTFDHRIRQLGYATIDANLSWSPDNSPFTLSIFGRNLTNKDILSGAFITTLADTVSYKPPRTFGVSAEMAF